MRFVCCPRPLDVGFSPFELLVVGIIVALKVVFKNSLYSCFLICSVLVLVLSMLLFD